ncbi:MAG: hypothetical protein JEZ02_00130 [Desulfatibacillum sp.]|nr:hypothetical protein [Desulfatibacillum sp.]
MAKTAGSTSPDLGPLVRIQFMNNETRGVDVSFNYEGVHFGPLEDGKEYDLPEKVVRHLNSLSTPRMEYRSDPATGQMKSVNIGTVHRFSCHPVSTPGAGV